MNTSWHSYPKVYNLGHAAIKELFEDEVIVSEKVDGSQYSAGKFNNELKVKSHNKELIPDAPDKMFTKAVEATKKVFPEMKEGWTYRFEYLSKPKHNCLAYDRVPKNNLICFDINDGEESYLPYEDKKKEAERLGFETVPLLYKGKVDKPDELKKLLETTSILGGAKIEGIVMKNYKRFDRGGKALMGKFVSEKFKEVHDRDWKERHPGKKDIILMLGEKYKTEARLQKAIMHLKEDGKYKGCVTDIGNLIKEIQSDVKEECEDEIKSALFSWAWPSIQRIIIRGVPERYKEILMEKQFENNETDNNKS